MLKLTAFLFFVFSSFFSVAQCINQFPYTEDFETTPGGWTSGGSLSDWAWGSPTKPIISSAYSVANCWITGGLNSSNYNLGEKSFLQSPCFDLSNLQYPYISFAVNWETERNFDGANLSYSIDGGNTWLILGSFADEQDCLNDNWFNNGSVNGLVGLANSNQGWSGSVLPTQGSCLGGGGSNGWKLAEHCMSNLAGESNVFFRFGFGAGTTCNSYDGFAFDDFSISEAPANTANFNFTCSGNNVTFSSLTSLCPTGFTWDFGDGTTGTGATVTHTYTSAGAYSVSLTTSGPCNAPGSFTRLVNIITLQISSTPVSSSCGSAADGSATVLVSPSNAAVNYAWNTTPAQQTATATNLSPGAYTVTVNGNNVCEATATVVISEPPAMNVQITASDDTCQKQTGAVLLNVSQGTSPYNYAWSNGVTTASLSQLTDGDYEVTVTDAAGCTATAAAIVGSTSGLSITPSLTNESCFGEKDGKITVTFTGDTTNLQYAWSNGSKAKFIQNLVPGTYSLTVTNQDGCSESITMLVEKEECLSYVFFPTGFSPNGDGVNDLFRPKYSIDLEKFNLQVYNRWGELVFSTADLNEGWNGLYQNTEQPMSTYVWTAQYNFRKKKPINQSGNVTLVR
jgi:gliding motility-associated-like protein